MRGFVTELNEFFERGAWTGRVDFLTIYITEAHAQDEWPIGSRYQYAQPRSLQARRDVARDFVRETGYKLPVVLDAIGVAGVADNGFESAYAPWPIRFYVIYNGRLEWIAQPEACSFSLRPLKAVLARLCGPGEPSEGWETLSQTRN